MPFLVSFDRIIPFVLYVKDGGGSNSADDTLGNILSFLTVIDVTEADVLESHIHFTQTILRTVCRVSVPTNSGSAE